MLAPAAARITFVGHSTVLIEMGGARILTDPMLRSRLGVLRRHGRRLGAAELGAIDLVLVSHAHLDHFDPVSLRELHGSPRIVVPAGLATFARARGVDVEEVRAGDRIVAGDISVTAVPARHGAPWAPLIPRSKPLGFLIDGPVRTYFAGDTELFSAMAGYQGAVDLALLPVAVWGPVMGRGHLDPVRAARAAALVGARVAIPIHWGTFYPAGLHRVWPGHVADPGHEFAHHVARIAPGTDARVLLPAESSVIDLASRVP